MENLGAELGKLCRDILEVLCDGCTYKISALKSAEHVQQPTNTGYAAALWKELRRRNGGKFPAKQDWVVVTKERLSAALKAARHCA